MTSPTPPGHSPYHPPDGPLHVLHLDDHIVAVNKPPGLLSVPGRGPELAECLLSRITAIWPDALLVHRLDRDTSGVMIFARTKAAQRHLGLQFERRHVKKTYLARILGRPPTPHGKIDLPLIADWSRRPKQKVDAVAGKRAVTLWRNVRAAGHGTSEIVLEPETGRSHQLRIHMAEIGCPIVGDPLYAMSGSVPVRRMMLHAQSLNFHHPSGGEKYTLSANFSFD